MVVWFRVYEDIHMTVTWSRSQSHDAAGLIGRFVMFKEFQLLLVYSSPSLPTSELTITVISSPLVSFPPTFTLPPPPHHFLSFTYTYVLIISTAAVYFMPCSMSATATSTGALPNPATQWTATHPSGFTRNVSSITSSHFLMISAGGAAPSSNGQSCSGECRVLISSQKCYVWVLTYHNLNAFFSEAICAVGRVTASHDHFGIVLL